MIPRPGTRRGRLLLFAAIVLGAAIATGGALLVTADGGGPEWVDGDLVDVRIEPGATARAVGQSLAAAGLIDHAWLFWLYVRLEGAERDLKAGHYRLVAGSSWGGLLNTIRSGEVVTHPLTIPEGLSLRETVPRLAAYTGAPETAVREVLDDTALVRQLGLPGPTLEGYLFPETYRFAEEVGVRAIVRELATRYRAFWGPEERRQADSLGLSEQEVVTLASIVEEEARLDEERPVIAAVYLNRLQIGMLLQADPTVQFALGAPKERLLYADIDRVADHPYNTYTHPGLPPGPIASPGEASLRAVLEPADVPYLFFVARPDGSHVFTRTEREHINAKNRIRSEGR